ncbi:MAG: hypothetical protein A2Z12_07880 [Actinobacteria bacterium RBG_16_68_21]|nr:MAG: hypothetical protein A2Z12_07880 [Actinobacteria bacterium RBG_16_68_21]
MGSNSLLRFLTGVTAVVLAAAAAGGVVLTLQSGAAPDDGGEYGLVRSSGAVVLEGVAEPGPGPFFDPVAVDLALDPLLLPLPPLNEATVVSPHHRNSAADLLAAGPFGHRLVQLERGGSPLTIAAVADVAGETLALSAALEDLIDSNGDGRDDDGRFTLAALDGSAVCVRLPVPRRLAQAQGLQLESGIPASGYWWSSYGPCGAPETAQAGSEARVGTTAGVYGATPSGEVCDVGALAAQLEADPRVAEAWVVILGVDPTAIGDYLDGLTAVILLRDTVVTDHFLDGSRILARSAILERGTAVLVDQRGVPLVRCLSGSPLRAAPPIPPGVTVEGAPWAGFSLELAETLPAASRATSRFVLMDLVTGQAVHRAPGVTGALTRLAGPLFPPASG